MFTRDLFYDFSPGLTLRGQCPAYPRYLFSLAWCAIGRLEPRSNFMGCFFDDSSSENVGLFLAMQRGLRVDDVVLSGHRRVEAHQSQVVGNGGKGNGSVVYSRRHTGSHAR